MLVKQTVFYLELVRPGRVPAIKAPKPPVIVRRIQAPRPELNRLFYLTIGRNWHWVDRSNWSIEDWRKLIERQDYETWIAYRSTTAVGYFELDFQDCQNPEIVYLGVMPGFDGQGLGQYLLQKAVRRVWRQGARRVWLHTCSHDHPAALHIYQKNGFRIIRQEIVEKEFS